MPLDPQKPQSTLRAYDPTPEEIERECRKIRAGWSEETYRQRAGGRTLASIRESMSWTPVVYTEKQVADILGSVSTQ